MTKKAPSWYWHIAKLWLQGQAINHLWRYLCHLAFPFALALLIGSIASCEQFGRMFEHCARINSAQQLVPTFSRWLPLPYFYRTRVRTWATLVSELTHWLLLTRVDWRCQLKTCWGCYCCWCWCRFVKFCSNFENMVWSRFWCWISDEISKLKFGQYFVADAWLRLWNLILVEILKLCLVKILKFSWNADVWSRF